MQQQSPLPIFKGGDTNCACILNGRGRRLQEVCSDIAAGTEATDGQEGSVCFQDFNKPILFLSYVHKFVLVITMNAFGSCELDSQ